MDSQKKSQDYNKLSTFELAFNLATGIYPENEKFEVLKVIKSRELIKPNEQIADLIELKPVLPKKTKPVQKGSKSEKIQKLIDGGMITAREIYDTLNKKGVKVYFPEIYRVLKNNSIG